LVADVLVDRSWAAKGAFVRHSSDLTRLRTETVLNKDIPLRWVKPSKRHRTFVIVHFPGNPILQEIFKRLKSFNHGWTPMNTDKKIILPSESATAIPFLKCSRIQSNPDSLKSVFIRIHPWLKFCPH